MSKRNDDSKVMTEEENSNQIDYAKLTVRIQRQGGSHIVGLVSVSDIRNVHWSWISGGCNVPQKGYSLYGYIDYSLAMEKVACSGTHEHYGNDAKVKIIIAPKGDECYEGYKYLLSMVGPKPKSNYNPLKLSPCTKMIQKVLKEHNGQMLRKELREVLVEMGYKLERYRSALKNLESKGIVSIDYNSNKSKERISLL